MTVIKCASVHSSLGRGGRKFGSKLWGYPQSFQLSKHENIDVHSIFEMLWWGFANSSDRQRLEAFMCRCVRLNLYRQDDTAVDQLVATCRGLFAAILSNGQHVLRCILPERNTHS